MRRPNVLFITVDDMNWDSVGALGSRLEGVTPNIDRLASEGMIFRRAHVTIGVCQPSRQSLLTGLYPHNNGGEGFERWVMVVTGGYAESGDPNHLAYSSSATAGRGIFIVDIKTGEVLAQQHFDPTASPGDPRRSMLYAMPSSPAVFDIDQDGYADAIYVGDLGGNVWKWVIRDVGADRVNGTGSPDDQPKWAK